MVNLTPSEIIYWINISIFASFHLFSNANNPKVDYFYESGISNNHRLTPKPRLKPFFFSFFLYIAQSDTKLSENIT